MPTIRIIAGDVQQEAELNSTRTAGQICDSLPIEAAGNRWGDEIYFSIPVDAGTELGQQLVEAGDLGYWEPGSAFCIFWGPTPASKGNEIRPSSPVTVFGKLLGDPEEFAKFRSGDLVRIERVDDE